MRCPDCNKFVSYDEQEPELDVQLDGATIEGTCRVVLPCAECGGELKEYTFDISVDVESEHTCPAEEPEEGWPEDEEQFELISENADFLSDLQTEYWDRKAKKMRPIKNYRYARTYYGATLTFDVKCLRCEEEFGITEEVKEQASAFDELV